MVNVTPENAERIRQYVLDCNIRRLTSRETAEYLKQKGLPVDVRTVKRYRARIKESAQNWVAKLAKSTRLISSHRKVFKTSKCLALIQLCQFWLVNFKRPAKSISWLLNHFTENG